MTAPNHKQNPFNSIRQKIVLARLREKLGCIYTEQSEADLAMSLLKEIAAKRLAERSPALKELDRYREANPDWFCANHFMAYSTYVDKFGGNLKGVLDRVDWLESLGVNYLHLLPFLKMRPGQSDGGFAVENFLEVEPALGDLQQLEELVTALRAKGISLCSDLVLNHVADTHEWAVKARAGDSEAQACFYWKTRDEADVLEQHLPQIFPQTAPGNFVFVPEVGKFVWSTFYQYQWDLNYANPRVLAAMADNMLGLANMGVEIFRLDSAAFLWKRDGTNSMNQQECHWLLQCLRAMVELVAPGVLLKAEAIVPTAELPPYFGLDSDLGKECQIAYQSSMMAGAWFSLANQNALLLKKQLQELPAMPDGTTWICYVRCHDDIGWNVLKPDLSATGHEQLRFASRFFGGNEQDSYANGMTFQASSPDAVHGTNGMLSELVGWQDKDDVAGYSRFKLMLALAFSLGGIPMVYMGDELAQSNAPSEPDDQDKWVDSRDLHRPVFDLVAQALAQSEPASRSAKALSLVRQLRLTQKQSLKAGNTSHLQLLDTGADAILAFRHSNVSCLYNFSSTVVTLEKSVLNAGNSTLLDLIEGGTFAADTITLAPYDSLWLTEHDA